MEQNSIGFDPATELAHDHAQRLIDPPTEEVVLPFYVRFAIDAEIAGDEYCLRFNAAYAALTRAMATIPDIEVLHIADQSICLEPPSFWAGLTADEYEPLPADIVEAAKTDRADLNRVADLAEEFLDDLESGVAEGTYDAPESADYLPVNRAAIATVRTLAGDAR